MKILSKNVLVKNKIVLPLIIFSLVVGIEILTPLPQQPPQVQHNNQVKKDNGDTASHRMIVLIHGTIFPVPHPASLIAAYKKKPAKHDTPGTLHYVKEGSFLQRYGYHLRYSLHYPHQSLSHLGLHTLDHATTPPTGRSASATIAHLCHSVITHTTLQKNQESYSFHTFGWGGQLNKKVRKTWARTLYASLIHEKKHLEQQTKRPVTIEIWTHSHGGNVALHLADIEQKRKLNIRINRLVMFCVPVQSDTENNINSPMFETIFHFYSRGDWIQRSDYISGSDFGSRNRFGEHKKKPITLPAKLTQIEVHVGSYKPQHCEFWLLGHVPYVYRNRFPLHPAPFLVFMPLVTYYLSHHAPALRDVLLQVDRIDDGITFRFKDKKAPVGTPCSGTAHLAHFSFFKNAIDAWYRNKKRGNCINNT